MPTPMTRRSLMATLASLCGAPSAALAVPRNARSDAAVIGRAVLRAGLTADELQHLKHQVATTHQPARLGPCCDKQMSHEFEIGHTITVEGWVLSRYEAKLYASAAMLDDLGIEFEWAEK